MVSSIVSNGETEGTTGSILELKDDHHPNLILDSLNMMRKNKHFCDAILHVGNVELHGHRAVLAAASPYLFDLFSSDTQRNNQTKMTYKLSDDIDKAALQKLIDYSYTSRLEVTPSEVKSIYLTASYLKMERVASQCVKYLLDSLTPECCLDIRSLPSITQNENFVKQVEAYIRNNFVQVCNSPALSSLPCMRIEVLYRTMQEMSLVNGTSLCCLILDWVKRFVTDSESVTMELLTQKTYLLYLAMDNSLQDCLDLPPGDVSDTDIVQDYKKLSSKTQAQNTGRRKGVLQPAKPRILIYSRNIEDRIEEQLEPDWNMIGVNKVSEHTFLAIVTLNGRLATLSVLLRLNLPSSPVVQDLHNILDPQVNITDEPEMYCALPTMKTGKCAVGCADLNGTLLVCGGYDRIECLKSVEQYIPETNTWKMIPAMKEARGRFGIAVVNGKVYAIGGSNGSTELATVEVLDPQADWKWLTIASLPLARSNSGICSLDSKIYCIGGWNGQAGIKQCDILNPEIGEWASIESLRIGRYQAGVCAFENKIYAAGGCDSWNCLNSVEIYNPELNTWSVGPSLITARRGCGLAVFHGRLYAIGGSSGTHSLTSTEVLDPSGKVWIPGPNMSTPRANVAVAVVGDRLYAVGGFTGKSFLNSIEYLDFHSNEWTTFIRKTDGISTEPSANGILSGSSSYRHEEDTNSESSTHSLNDPNDDSSKINLTDDPN